MTLDFVAQIKVQPTFATPLQHKVLPLEGICPLADVVEPAAILGILVSEQIGVRMGDLGT